jgi:hypothetical protein
MTAPRAALREPMLWLIIAIPLATVIGGLTTLWLAEQSGQSDVVPEDVQRTAQAQVVDLAPDIEAARRHLSAHVAVDANNGAVRADLVSPNADDALVIKFVHGLRAADDVTLPMAREGDHWQASLPPMVSADWRLALEDAHGHWRLIGRLPRGSHQAQLLPAVMVP